MHSPRVISPAAALPQPPLSSVRRVESTIEIPAMTAKRADARPAKMETEVASPAMVTNGMMCVAIMPKIATPRAVSIPIFRLAGARRLTMALPKEREEREVPKPSAGKTTPRD